MNKVALALILAFMPAALLTANSFDEFDQFDAFDALDQRDQSQHQALLEQAMRAIDNESFAKARTLIKEAEKAFFEPTAIASIRGELKSAEQAYDRRRQQEQEAREQEEQRRIAAARANSQSSSSGPSDSQICSRAGMHGSLGYACAGNADYYGFNSPNYWVVKALSDGGSCNQIHANEGMSSDKIAAMHYFCEQQSDFSYQSLCGTLGSLGSNTSMACVSCVDSGVRAQTRWIRVYAAGGLMRCL